MCPLLKNVTLWATRSFSQISDTTNIFYSNTFSRVGPLTVYKYRWQELRSLSNKPGFEWCLSRWNELSDPGVTRQSPWWPLIAGGDRQLIEISWFDCLSGLGGVAVALLEINTSVIFKHLNIFTCYFHSFHHFLPLTWISNEWPEVLVDLFLTFRDPD